MESKQIRKHPFWEDEHIEFNENSAKNVKEKTKLVQGHGANLDRKAYQSKQNRQKTPKHSRQHALINTERKSIWTPNAAENVRERTNFERKRN